MAQMSSSTFSRSLTKLPVTSSPSLSTHSVRKRSLLAPPMAICWMPRTLNGRGVMRNSDVDVFRRPGRAEPRAPQATPADPAVPVRWVAPLGRRSEATGGPSYEFDDHLIDRQTFTLPCAYFRHHAILRREQNV